VTPKTRGDGGARQGVDGRQIRAPQSPGASPGTPWNPKTDRNSRPVKMATDDEGGAALVAPEERAELRRLAGAAGDPGPPDPAAGVPRGAAARPARFQALVSARAPPRARLASARGEGGGGGTASCRPVPGRPRPPPPPPEGGVHGDRAPPPAFPADAPGRGARPAWRSSSSGGRQPTTTTTTPPPPPPGGRCEGGAGAPRDARTRRGAAQPRTGRTD